MTMHMDGIEKIGEVTPLERLWENNFPLNLTDGPFEKISPTREFTVNSQHSKIEDSTLSLLIEGKGFWLSDLNVESYSELKDGHLDLYIALKQKTLYGVTSSNHIIFNLNEWGIDPKNISINVYVKNENGQKELKATIKS